jgi:putative nucleotidyltransferase with HDIG domain
VHDALPVAAASLVYLVVNNTLVSVVLGLKGRSFAQEWLESSRDILLPYASMGPLGALVAYTYASTQWAILYFIPLVFVIYNGFRLFVTLQHETDHALVALADSIDKRDQYTFQHSLRVAKLSGEIAEAMGVTPRDVDLLIAAARVHDLGKIATDNRVLFKRSSLTADERSAIQAHSVEGGELAGRFSMFRQGRRFIRHHHERWDGKGYPDGIAGEDIPLGARIIAVADSYDAMTSDRPYRKALPHEVALVELRRGAGTQFDPMVVEAFVARQSVPQTAHAPLIAETSESCSY